MGPKPARAGRSSQPHVPPLPHRGLLQRGVWCNHRRKKQGQRSLSSSQQCVLPVLLPHPLVVVRGSAFHQLRGPRVQTSSDLFTNFGRMQLNSMLGAMGFAENHLRKEKLTTSATFLLLRLVRNLKGSQVIKLFEAMEQNKMMSQQKDFTEESL